MLVDVTVSFNCTIPACVVEPEFAVILTEDPRATEPPPDRPEPTVTETLEFARDEFGTEDNLAFGNVPDEIFEALVVSVVAELTKPDTCDDVIAIGTAFAYINLPNVSTDNDVMVFPDANPLLVND